MKTAYLDCFSGISGDMFLGALLDAGLSFDELTRRLKSLPLEDYDLIKKQRKRNSISGTGIFVQVNLKRQRPRNLADIKEIIKTGDLSQSVKERSFEIFEALAKVEGKIHGRPMEDVHFHEVGAVDSIIDVVGAVYGIESMEIGDLYASALPLGSGFIETDHGKIPVPAPATLALLESVPVYDSGVSYEMVTPTGAALLKKLVVSFGTMPPMVI